MAEHSYIAIDLKSFFASVECVERGLDPLNTNLVVADSERTEKTICLAVSPSLKAYGIPGRARLFEVIQRVKEVNGIRRQKNGGKDFSGESFLASELAGHPELSLGYVTARPRMAKYKEYSARIFNIYMKYVAPEDIHVYSIDEVFMDVTAYRKTYPCSPRELARRMIKDVYETTGITATAGIGTNLYLCKVAMDVWAKHVPADEDGVRIAQLDEISYRRQLWDHRPITDFWRVGPGYAKKLAEHGMYTMGDVARCSIGDQGSYHNEDLLYRLFGVSAELLIDHAWGWEPCTIAEIKAYRPETNSISSGQVLKCPYDAEKARLIVREMADLLSLDLVDKQLVTDQLVLTIGYDVECLKNPSLSQTYHGEVSTDRYGRRVPKHAHGSRNLEEATASTRQITEAAMELYDRIIDERLLVRRVTIAACRLKKESELPESGYEQLELFMDIESVMEKRREQEREKQKEKQLQHAVLDIKKKYGKNAIFKGMNLVEGATAIERNGQIGGHKA